MQNKVDRLYEKGDIIMSLPVALQLYSVRDDFARDTKGTLENVKKMGYDGVEIAGFGDYEPDELKNMLDSIGLRCISAHVPFGDMTANPEKVFSDYKNVGCDYVSIPWLDLDIAPGGKDFDKTIPQIKRMGELAKAKGLTLLYHNHDFEFRKVDGQYGLDILYNSVPAEYLQTQIDTCWVNVAGENPAEYLRKYAGRAPLVHLKDFVMTGKTSGALYDLIGEDETDKDDSGDFSFKPVGYGVQDMPAILAACKQIGALWVVVEQDTSTERTPM